MIRFSTLALILLGTTPLLAQEVQQVDGPPLWGSDLRTVEEVRIGDREEEEYLFGRIAAVAVTDNGNIWVGDDSVPIIRLYDAQGEYIRDVGAAGEGPGEYNRIMGLKRMVDDSVWLFDPRNRRISVFDPDGNFVVAHPVDSGTHSSDAFHVDGRGNAYVLTMDGEAPRQPNGDPASSLIRVNSRGESEARVEWPPENQENGFVLLSPSGYRKPFFPEIINAVTAEGVVLRADNQSYSIDLGHDVRLQRDFQPIRLDGEERSQWIETARRFEERSGKDYASRIPRSKPAFRNVRVFGDGRIWVDVYTEAEYEARSPRADGSRPLEWHERRPVMEVIGSDGTFFGRVPLPEDTYLYEARGEYIWAERELEDGSPIIVRLRIEAAGS